ncbi:DUF1566 domain-containing protein [Pseudomonas qingdaonensis]|uniref:DUF1566 domain-containing protein n=1 Tax=Pseudomonas qingdaonensis TaxID=2056231 RepID=A0ABX8DVK8_9PSED|nr:DUF1566 domain-containing protein [Pseudomonas qingdaonensis]QVL20172.1 DUF1566 domain-containing protein [Pseudomonas qingdaonensis]
MEHAPLIGTINVTLAMPPAVSPAASALFGALLSAAKEPAQAQAAAPKLTPPAIGEYWPGQGGIYAGIRQYAEGLCHVIFAAQDVGKHAYGEHGTEVEATSRTDGRQNTLVLTGRNGSHPAAGAAFGFTCDGHSDFYLPAIAELSHAWANIPEHFETEWYWSSSQRSASSAFNVDFADGYQGFNVKDDELRVRPVRRFLQ